MTTITDADVARMPRVAEVTLADTFHWTMTEEERLYRDCPTAFWLAPGADICAPAEPVLAVTSEPEALEPIDTAWIPTGCRAAVLWPLLVAGPVFVASTGLVFDGSGTPLSRMASSVGLALVSFPLTIPFGAVLALLPVLLGVATLAWLGREHAVARDTRLWAATGAGLGLLIGALFDAGMVSVSLVLTAVACATVARRAIDWVEPEFA